MRIDTTFVFFYEEKTFLGELFKMFFSFLCGLKKKRQKDKKKKHSCITE